MTQVSGLWLTVPKIVGSLAQRHNDIRLNKIDHRTMNEFVHLSKIFGNQSLTFCPNDVDTARRLRTHLVKSLQCRLGCQCMIAFLCGVILVAFTLKGTRTVYLDEIPTSSLPDQLRDADCVWAVKTTCRDLRCCAYWSEAEGPKRSQAR